jgi:hypothetical protein
MGKKSQDEGNPRAVPEKLLVRAAELRAAGLSWRAVARQVERSEITVQRWPWYYPVRWDAAYRQAEAELVDEAAAESVVVLRQMLRSEDVKVQQSAAAKLMAHRGRLERRRPLRDKRKSPDHERASRPALRLAAFLENLSEDEEMQLLERALPGAVEELERYRERRGASGAAGAGAVCGAVPPGTPGGGASAGEGARGAAELPAPPSQGAH